MALGSLVIVESPAKAKTINKILGKEYLVKASFGHIMDLPQKKLGVDEEDFTPVYETIPGKEKVIKELKQAAKGLKRIYIATDPDREGEAIASHIAEVLGKGAETYRVVFNEITEKAVREAFEHAGQIDRNKVDAQQARRVLDRLVGYKLSPLLWKKIRRGLSAGRVQSVALRLVVDREREIEAFIREEYWSLDAVLSGPVPSHPPNINASLFKYEGAPVIDRDAAKRFLITNEEQARNLTDALGKEQFVVSAVDKKTRKRAPYPPFITSTLQQEAARKLGFAAKRTMQLAQQLYEGVELGEKGAVGLITYMRTDSVRVAAEAQEWVRLFIGKTYGKEYVPEKPNVYKSRASAQEAHEAIRPTYAECTPEAVKPFLSRDHMRLYLLIWNRFVASQMKPAALEQTAVDISAGSAAVFRASGSVVKFPGFMAVYSETKDEAEEEEGGLIPPLKTGDKLGLIGLEPVQHFTQPPPRFSEASLVKTLEEKGIGRPSTYATILSTLTDRKYVQKDVGRFAPTELGTIVNDYLVDKFPALLDVGFTANMEYELDHIEDGKFAWVKVVEDFYKPFSLVLSEASQAQGKVKPEDIATDVVCDKCGSPMVIRWGRHGRFLACTAYPKCKNTKPLEGERPQTETVATEEVCPKCGAPMVLKTGKFGKFLACSRYPECKTTRPLPTGVKCPEDGGDIISRMARGGRTFWSCSNYPACKFALWSRPVPEKCPKCGAEFLLIKKDKDGGLIRFCHRKDCGFQEHIEPEAQ